MTKLVVMMQAPGAIHPSIHPWIDVLFILLSNHFLTYFCLCCDGVLHRPSAGLMVLS